MDLHLQGVSDRTKLAYQYIEPRAMELYGQLSDHTMEKFKQIADSGVEVAFTPQYHGGYLRLASG
jgi:hypothetical protein